MASNNTRGGARKQPMQSMQEPSGVKKIKALRDARKKASFLEQVMVTLDCCASEDPSLTDCAKKLSLHLNKHYVNYQTEITRIKNMSCPQN